MFYVEISYLPSNIRRRQLNELAPQIREVVAKALRVPVDQVKFLRPSKSTEGTGVLPVDVRVSSSIRSRSFRHSAHVGTPQWMAALEARETQAVERAAGTIIDGLIGLFAKNHLDRPNVAGGKQVEGVTQVCVNTYLGFGTQVERSLSSPAPAVDGGHGVTQ